MNKLILSLLLLSSLYAESTIYMGIGAGLHHEHLNSNGDDTVSPMMSIKAGYGDIKAYAIEFSVDYVDTKSKTILADGGPRYGLNVSLLKAFDFDIFFIPFIRAGFGAGVLSSTAKAEQDSLSYGSFNLGTGAFIPLSQHIDLEVGYDYRNVTYERTSATATLEEAHTNVAYVGCNFRY